MEHRTLGPTGTAVATIALGTMDFGSLTPEADAHAILDAYLDAGGNFIDTSNVYNGGLVEEILGRWFADRPSDVTDRVVLTTKGRFSPDPDINAVGSSRRGLRRSLDGSLRRLGRDHVDLYQLHAWDPITPIEETLSFLDDAVHAGKINYVGLSNFTGWQLQLTLSTAKQMGVALPVTIQQQYSLLSRESEWEVVPAALHNGVGVLPWSPLAGGFLSGKYRRGTAPGPDTRAGSGNPLYQWVSAEYAGSDRTWAVIDAVVGIAEEIGATPTQVALSWLADRPAVVAPITSARTVEHLAENLGASGLHLDATATSALDELSAPRSGGYPYGAFGSAQRSRNLEGRDSLVDLISAGSDTPTGTA
jgi:aryl-alcohol dehydrogenase-like predicted oxidoreductase